MTAHRIIQVYAGIESIKVIDAIAEKKTIIRKWKTINKDDGEVHYSFIIDADKTQEIMDALDATAGYTEKMRAIVLPIEATIPRIEEEKKEEKTEEDLKENVELKPNLISREELIDDVEDGIILNKDFVMLVFFSTIVGAIGLVKDNITVVIGAMVIAPLLWPSIAFPFSVTIGDKNLMRKSLKTAFFGLLFCAIFSLIFSKFLSSDDLLNSREIMNRTVVGFDNVLLALVSGAAAVLSLTTGLSSIMVGVMVAVAVLPPMVTACLMFGVGFNYLGMGAAFLLVVNLVCINLSAQLIFLLKKVGPRKTDERRMAKKMVFYNIFFSSLLLAALAYLIHSI